MKKKIVILGATGTVGSKISAILLNEGHQVTLVARHTEKLEKFRDLGAKVIAADTHRFREGIHKVEGDPFSKASLQTRLQ